MKVPVLEYLDVLRNEEYVIFKRSKILPEYESYSDIDLIVRNLVPVSEALTAFSETRQDVFRTVTERTAGHFHLDIYNPPSATRLDFRFDVLSTEDVFPLYDIDEDYWSQLFGRREVVNIAGHSIYVPANIDECALRFLEYVTYAAKRPDKKKHLRYIKKRGSWDFLDILRTQTKCPMTDEEVKELVNAS